MTYGKSRHRLLNYVVFYTIDDDDKYITVINILPGRSERKRVQ